MGKACMATANKRGMAMKAAAMVIATAMASENLAGEIFS